MTVHTQSTSKGVTCTIPVCLEGLTTDKLCEISRSVVQEQNPEPAEYGGLLTTRKRLTVSARTTGRYKTCYPNGLV
jgi:hypothetical protein